ncbi:hypothetical protein fugu_019833 [Takifugu bimaculatus]|uniref:Leukotriene A-4 hydrolase n=1 Tax=Takifugu bimaculatus TaxID=433685 RepID=A0A4Z2BGN2_9TELE|nr:hypothetical protein fugu_019833 [Takifugu bimaculatus]
MADPCSFSSFNRCVTKHLNLTLHVDFDSRVIRGRVALTVEALQDRFSALTLDTKDLKIISVSAHGQAAQFTMGPKHSFKGTPLDVTLPFDLSRGQHVIVEVTYETSPSATALQWLTPEQTAGKKQPYLFSQCQAHHCRSMVPCQDSPSVKHTYYAQVSVPKELVAVMSAVGDGQEVDAQDNNRVVYRFRQPVPMPSYLIAIVVGALESRLNEGHTVYLERMIGRCMEGEQFRQFKAMGGWKDLQDSVNTFGVNNPLTNLVPSLQDVDPDEAFSSVPYEKGFALLYHLEELMGGPEVFMGFVKAYIQLFAYSSVTTEDWKTYLFTYFKDKVDILNKVDWNLWMFTPGMPPVRPQYDTSMADTCIALAHRWTTAKDQDLNTFTESDVKTLSSHQLIEFLSLLLQEDPLPLSHVKKMQELYDLNACMNSEIRCRWLRLCVRSKWEEAVPMALKMATEQGRMKFTRPLFREVFNFEKYREEAVSRFVAHRAAMHPVTSALVAKDLKVTTGL